MTKNESKNYEEFGFLNKFLKTPIGKNWYKENSIVEIVKSESPDFLFKTNDGKTLALEITQFIAKNENSLYSQTLTRIGNQLCKEIKEKYNLKVSMIIDKYDERKFNSSWTNYISLANNPGFSEVPSINIFKAELRKFIDINIDKLRKNTFTKGWIKTCNDYYQISVNCYTSITTQKYDCHVNNGGWIKTDPFEELQDCINKKNKKVNKYRADNDKCCLLIFVPDYKMGNYCSFTDEILKHYFISNFDSVFLYEEDTNASWNLIMSDNVSYSI